MTDPRQNVAGLRFGAAGPIEYFHAAGMRLEVGESVVVQTSRGPELARVVIAPEQVVVNELGEEHLRPILRLAAEDDLRRADELADRARELLPEARALAEETGLRGRVERAEFTLDGERLTFLAGGEGGDGEREFTRHAGRRWGARAAVRRIGARERARLAGGYGICGRELCCSSWLTAFPAVSIRQAKDQELSLNSEKISGLCGRLLCCLSYEEEGYKEMRRSLPRLGQRCSTPTGEGKVVALNVLRRRVTLNVDGQRVEVGERDLGLVVRWDPSSRGAEPPPAITREEAVAQGLIEPDDPPAPEAEAAVAMPEAAPIALGGEGERGRSTRKRRGRSRAAGGEGAANTRVYRRPPGDRPAGGESAPKAAGDGANAEGKPRRRRRRRRRGRGGGGTGDAG